MSLSDYGITLENTETVLLLAAAVAAVAILMTVFLRAVRAFAQYRLMRAANGRGAWRAFVPVLSLSALGDLAAEHNPRVRFAGKAAAFFSLLCALTFYCGAVFFFDSLLRVLFAADSAAAAGAESLAAQAWSPVFTAFYILLAGLVLWLIKQIFAAVCLAAVYKSSGLPPFICIFGVILPILTPIFLTCCAGKADVKN